MDSPLLRGRMFRLPMAGLLLFALVLAGLFGEGCRNPSPVTTSSVTAASSIPFSPLSTSSSSAPAGAVSSSTTSTTLAPSTSTILITTTTAAVRLPPLAFDTARAMEHIRDLAIGIGIRPGGSVAEYKAAMYAADYLSEIGYDPVVTEVPLPNGKTSHNVTAVKNGASPLTVVVGAHLDTKKTTPGGNDDASGAAVVLELARDVANADLAASVVFVLFGTEEIIDADKSHHHYGSRSWVENMTLQQKRDLVAMISLDMGGYGKTFHVRTMTAGPLALSDMLLVHAKADDIELVYLEDTGPTGWSDHEPFERAGYPGVWLQWLDDPCYHKMGDTYEHCDKGPVQVTGRFLLDFLTGLSNHDLEELQAAVRH